MSTTQTTYREKGVSLARGPALALGTFLVIAGLYFIYTEHGFPRLSSFPNSTVHINGKAFFGVFGLNGWSGELTVASGALLIFGAAQHLLAKATSFIVAVILAGVGIWALADHHSALGLFAANIWTVLLWFAAAAYLLINSVLPRTPGSDPDTDTATETPTPVVHSQPLAEPQATTTVSTGPRTVEPATMARQPVQTDTSSIIPERAPIRVRPTGGTDSDDGSMRNDETPPTS